MFRILRFVLALLALLPLAASAQGSGRFELTPTVSYNFGGTLTGTDEDFFEFDLDARESEAFGLTFDIPLAPWAQIELLASRQQTELEFDDGIFYPDQTVADLEVSYYHVGGLFQWGSGQIHPFVVVSLGTTRFDADVPGADAEYRFSGSFGGGVKIFFNEHVGFRLEGRGFWTVVDDDYEDDYWCDYGCYHDYGYESSFNQGQASAGLILAW